MSIDLSFIKVCEPLSILSEEIQISISKQASLAEFPSHTQLFDNGNKCDALPLVISGSIRVFKQSENGREISLYRVNKNQVCIVTLGCLFGSSLYPASGLTEGPVQAIILPRTLFLHLIEHQPLFSQHIFKLFSSRISILMQLIDEITFHKLDQRLASFLLHNGPNIYESHQEIADELGSVREIVSRLLKQFEDKNWIVLGRKKIEVKNIPALKKYLSDV